MTRTSQLDAHYAVIQLNAVLQAVVPTFQRSVDLLIAESRERGASLEERHQLRALLDRYRAAVLELGDTFGELRAQCGACPNDLPAEEDDVRAELARLREAHDRSQCRRPAAGPAWSRGGKDGGR